jgi:hypothetical protein
MRFCITGGRQRETPGSAGDGRSQLLMASMIDIGYDLPDGSTHTDRGRDNGRFGDDQSRPRP